MYRDSHRVDVLFFVEHRDRELEVVSAIAKDLRERHGLRVAIASTLFHPLLSALTTKPRVVVSTGIAPSASENQGPEFIHAIFQALYGDSITYACMNWEQVLSPINKSFRPPRDSFTKKTVHHVSWGAEYRDFLISCGVQPDRIRTTGKPALSLLRDKLGRRHEAIRTDLARRTGVDLKKRWFFFPMTCHLAFFSDYHVRSRIGVGSDEKTVLEHAAYVRRTIDTIFRWLGQIDDSAASNNVSIVLRPHPSVSVEQYEERFASLIGQVPAAVHVTKEGNAYEWLAVSEACLTNYSSLALDAVTVGRPAYLLEPEPFPWFLDVDWFHGIPRVATFDELVATFSGGHRTAAVPSDVISKHSTGDLDGVTATAERLADLARTAPPGRLSVGGFRRVMTGIHRRRAAGSLLRFAAAATGLWRLVRPGIRPDYFSRRDVEQIWRASRIS